MLRKIWNDPVWSKVISATIISMGAIIYSLVISKLNELSFWKTLLKTLISPYFLGLVILLLISYILFDKLKKKKKVDELEDSKNSLAKAKNSIDSLDEKIVRDIFNEQIAIIDLKLKKIYSNNEIVIGKFDVIDVWASLIKKAESSFYASNLLPSYEWKHVNTDKFGIEPQKEAINKRGVDVKRVSFYYPAEKHKNGILELYGKQKEAGIPSDIRPIEDLNYTYNSLIQELRTADITFVDNKILLLTYLDIHYDMEYALLCFDENRIKCARIFFQKLFEGCFTEKNK